MFIPFIMGLVFIFGAKSFSAKHPNNPKHSVKSYIGAGLIEVVFAIIGTIIIAIIGANSGDFKFDEIDKMLTINFLKFFGLGIPFGLVAGIIAIGILMLKKQISWSENRKLCIIAPIVVALIIGFCVGFTTFDTDSSNNREIVDEFGHDEADAITIAKNEVESRLKSPSTAEFCPTSDVTISCDDNTWTVSGWVDAQNSFGATLRNEYTVKITFSSRNKYTIDYCNIS
jgi:fluoride ion exporter CrcB/FEX